ncbi:MAG: sulfurtransferase [Deltaproteobacteria bacterium]|nr:sulfurtransferase [Deltaproteobacteria bacterium]
MKTIIIATILSIFFPIVLSQPAAAAISDYFVETSWLAQNLDQVTVVDVRVKPKYLLGHIDGALHIDKNEFLSFRRGVKSLVPTVEEFQRLMIHYGITPETTVIVYAEHTNPYSARLVWTLKYYGHEKAYVLNGGYEKWAKEGRPLGFLPTKAVSIESYVVSDQEPIRAKANEVLTSINDPGTIIWDVRRLTEFEGTEVRADRGGHIPSATHLNWTELLHEENGIQVLKPAGELTVLLASHGITPDKKVIAHCQTGIRSAYASLVLMALGYPEVRNYDGSWIEWANNRDLPIVTSSAAFSL